MLVKDRMTPDPVVITTDTSLKEALEIVRSKPFRHLPVLDENGKLVGIVTEKSLVYASPTSTTALSVFEVDYILSRTKVGQIIQGSVVTVGPGWPVEEAVGSEERLGLHCSRLPELVTSCMFQRSIARTFTQDTNWRRKRGNHCRSTAQWPSVPPVEGHFLRVEAPSPGDS